MPRQAASEPIEAFATLHECCATARVARIHLFGTFALARSFSTQCAGLARLANPLKSRQRFRCVPELTRNDAVGFKVRKNGRA